MNDLRRQPIFTNVRLREGVRARVYFNDLPLFQGIEGGGFSLNGGITHLLVPGENEVAVEILVAPAPRDGRLEYTPDPRPDMNGFDLNQTIEVFVFKERAPETKEIEIIHHFMFPDLWKDVPEERRQRPFYHRSRFDPGAKIPELAFLSVKPQQIPCAGTPALHEAVRELHGAIVSKNLQATIDAMGLQMREFTASNPADPGTTPAAQIEALEQMFAEEIVVAPLIPEQLHFTPRAGDRVAHVERLDSRPVIDVKTVGVPQGTRFDPLFTLEDGRWRLM